jgi:hypothetical protein
MNMQFMPASGPLAEKSTKSFNISSIFIYGYIQYKHFPGGTSSIRTDRQIIGYGMCSDKNFIKLRMLIYVDTEYCNS